jgi:hypothetical protein
MGSITLNRRKVVYVVVVILSYVLAFASTGWTVRDRIPVVTRFSACPDRPWGPPSHLYNVYLVFPGGKVRPGRAADHSPPSSVAVMAESSCTFTHPLGHTGPVTGTLYYHLPERTK